MIRHIVMWNLGCEPEDRQAVSLKIKEGLEGLKGKIGELIDIKVVENLNLEDRDRKDLALIVDLASMEDLALYAGHEEHLRVLGQIKPYLRERVVIDFEIN